MSLEHAYVLMTFGLVILIWLIQLVHYPSFAFYDNSRFSEGMIHHQRWISVITIPMMVCEMGLTLLIFFKYQNVHAVIGLALLLIVWVSTFSVQVPLHKKLSHNKDLSLIRKLVTTNWVRTVAWSFKFIASVYL
jgi:hypothetical protein